KSLDRMALRHLLCPTEIRALRLVFGRDYRKLGELDLSSVQHFILKLMVKEKQEKDKIESKPDKNEKRGEAREKSKSITVKRERKNEENTSQGTKDAKSFKVLLIEEKEKG
nr:hypothetical protein [Tanacetum cinerariifolium]